MKAVVREINIKPSCAHELIGLPSDQSAQIWEKINRLVDDPLPDGKLKKKLKVSKDPVYRLRSGDYRIFYRFGDTWVRLLGVRQRNKATYRVDLAESKEVSPAAPPPDSEESLDELLAAGEKRHDFKFKTELQSKPLPRELSEEWLKEVKVPVGYFPHLIPCKTEDELLSAAVPQAIVERLVDNLFPKAIEDVATQPDLVVRDTSDLVRYKEGELLSFLLKLDPDQMKLTDWALKGPTMIKGGAGTGKSTVVLYRVKSLLEQPGATGKETVLFATYTRALMAASRQLLEQLLSKEQYERVRVATCDEIAYEIATGQHNLGSILAGKKLDALFRKVREGFAKQSSDSFKAGLARRKLATLTDRYLLDEFEWIIDGRGLGSLDDYLETKRPGRGIAFGENLRREMWKLYEVFKKAVAEANSVQYVDIRKMALKHVQEKGGARRYDYVVVDEAQDLASVALALMAELAVSGEGLCCAADNKQSLYSRSYTWASAHPRLQFRGRSALLKRNYRSTFEIDRAAFDVITPEQGEDLQRSSSAHNGPLPVMLKGCSTGAEGTWVARFIRQMSSHLRMKTNAAAVLTFTKKEGERLAEELREAGLPAKFFEGRNLDLKDESVKVITLHSAKGLEFPVVVLAGICADSFPDLDEYDDEKLFAEHMRNHRRLLYVGLTRAMRGLAMVVPEDCINEAITDLGSRNWHIENISDAS